MQKSIPLFAFKSDLLNSLLGGICFNIKIFYHLVIIFFILITFTFDQELIL